MGTENDKGYWNESQKEKESQKIETRKFGPCLAEKTTATNKYSIGYHFFFKRFSKVNGNLETQIRRLKLDQCANYLNSSFMGKYPNPNRNNNLEEV